MSSVDEPLVSTRLPRLGGYMPLNSGLAGRRFFPGISVPHDGDGVLVVHPGFPVVDDAVSL